MYPSAGRALHTLGRKVGGGGARAPSAPPVPPPLQTMVTHWLEQWFPLPSRGTHAPAGVNRGKLGVSKDPGVNWG